MEYERGGWHLEVAELAKGGHQLRVRRPLVSSLEPTFFGHGSGAYRP